jgi:hypothetical protein
MRSCPPRHALCNRAPSGRQASRPASACRLLLTHTSSNSSAYSALSCTLNSFAARVYRIAYPHSIHNIRAESQADRTICRNAFTHEQACPRQQSPPQPLWAHCPLAILARCASPSFVPYTQRLLLRTKPARPPSICHSAFLTSLRRAPPIPH